MDGAWQIVQLLSPPRSQLTFLTIKSTATWKMKFPWARHRLKSPFYTKESNLEWSHLFGSSSGGAVRFQGNSHFFGIYS